jgi:hypothetical protein
MSAFEKPSEESLTEFIESQSEEAVYMHEQLAFHTNMEIAINLFLVKNNFRPCFLLQDSMEKLTPFLLDCPNFLVRKDPISHEGYLIYTSMHQDAVDAYCQAPTHDALGALLGYKSSVSAMQSADKQFVQVSYGKDHEQVFGFWCENQKQAKNSIKDLNRRIARLPRMCHVTLLAE